MTTDFDPALHADRELERRLEAYADLRLTPDPVTSARDRRRVMAVAHRVAAFQSTGVPTPAVPAEGVRGPRAPRGWARPFTAMSAALLTLGMLAGTAAAARPGGPLYGAFVTAERWTLPGGDMTARAQAEAHRLDVRLHEALAASAVGDDMAAVAALTAYSTIVVEAGGEVVGDRDALVWFQHYVFEHLASLTAMLAVATEPARPAVEAAIEGSTRFLEGAPDTPPGTGAGSHPGSDATGPGDQAATGAVARRDDADKGAPPAKSASMNRSGPDHGRTEPPAEPEPPAKPEPPADPPAKSATHANGDHSDHPKKPAQPKAPKEHPAGVGQRGD